MISWARYAVARLAVYADCWIGFGFDGHGLWATGASKPVIVLAESVSDYVTNVKRRPNNVLYGSIAVFPPKAT